MGQGFLHGPSAGTARLANDGLVLILSSPHVDEPSAVPSLRSNHLMPKKEQPSNLACQYLLSHIGINIYTIF